MDKSHKVLALKCVHHDEMCLVTSYQRGPRLVHDVDVVITKIYNEL